MAAPVISQTLIATRHRISRRLNDLWTGTATGGTAGSGATDGTLTATGDYGRYPTSPAYFKGHQISTTSGTGSGQSRVVNDYTVATGVGTFSVEPWTAPDATTVFELHRKFTKQQYDDAINSAISSLAGTYFTDKYDVLFAIERGNVGNTQIVPPRYEYPMPTGYNYLYSLQYLNTPPAVINPIGYTSSFQNFGQATSNSQVTQSLQVPQSGFYQYFAVGMMTGYGTATDNVSVYLSPDNGSGLPTGAVLSTAYPVTSDLVTGSKIPDRLGYVVFQFNPPVYLTQGITYHFVLQRGAPDASNYFLVGVDGSNHYSNGQATVYNSGSGVYTPISGSDLCFSLTAASSSWIPMAPRRGGLDGWEYRRIGTDVLFIPSPPREGTPIRVVGFAPIAEVSAETDTIPVRPDYVQAKAILELGLGQAGDALADDYARKASMWAQNMETQPKPYRAFPPNTIEVFA